MVFIVLTGGQCINKGEYIKCACPCGYAGDKCEMIATEATFAGGPVGTGGIGQLLDFCTDNKQFCLNGGVCRNNKNGQGMTCFCKSGWYGTYCQLRGKSDAHRTTTAS